MRNSSKGQMAVAAGQGEQSGLANRSDVARAGAKHLSGPKRHRGGRCASTVASDPVINAMELPASLPKMAREIRRGARFTVLYQSRPPLIRPFMRPATATQLLAQPLQVIRLPNAGSAATPPTSQPPNPPAAAVPQQRWSVTTGGRDRSAGRPWWWNRSAFARGRCRRPAAGPSSRCRRASSCTQAGKHGRFGLTRIH